MSINQLVCLILIISVFNAKNFGLAGPVQRRINPNPVQRKSDRDRSSESDKYLVEYDPNDENFGPFLSSDNIEYYRAPKGVNFTVRCPGANENSMVEILVWHLDTLMEMTIQYNKSKDFPFMDNCTGRVGMNRDYSLTLCDVSYLDTGNYQCLINHRLVPEVMIRFIVVDVPDPPGRPLVVAFTTNTAKILWPPPRHMGGLSHYTIITRQHHEAPNLSQMALFKSTNFTCYEKNTTDTKTIGEVDDLIPFTVYSFVVIAWNMIGASPPSEPSYFIVTLSELPLAKPVLNAHNLSSTAISVFWDQPKLEELRGDFHGYRLSWKRLTPAQLAAHEKFIRNIRITNMAIPNLEPNTAYEVGLRVENVVGEGPLSSLVVVTEEGSLDTELPYLTLCILSVRKLFNQSATLPLIPKALNFATKKLWSTLSKALEKSDEYAALNRIISADESSRMGHAFVYVGAIFWGAVLAQESTTIQSLNGTTTPSVTTEISTTAKVSQGNDTSTIDVSAPSAPRNIELVNYTATTIVFQFDMPEHPNSKLQGYRIYFHYNNFTDQKTDRNEPEEPHKVYKLDNLIPDTEYTIAVKAFSASQEGNLSEHVDVVTDIRGPSPPIFVNVSCEFNNSILVAFRKPKKYADIVERYVIELFQGDGSPYPRDPIQLSADRNPARLMGAPEVYVIEDLEPDKEYLVQMYAIARSRRTNSLVEGDRTYLKNVQLTKDCHVEVPPFQELWAGVLAGLSCAAGVIFLTCFGYYFWRTRCRNRNNNNTTAERSTKQYTGSSAEDNYEITDEIIEKVDEIDVDKDEQPQTELNEVRINHDANNICLKESVKATPFMWAQTEKARRKRMRRLQGQPPSFFMDYEQCTPAPLDWNERPPPRPLLAIENGPGGPENLNPGLDALVDERMITDYSGPVDVSMFPQHVQRLHADGDIGFSKEYDAIQNDPSNEGNSCELSQQPENKMKNRYLNIIAYDHSRVQLLPLPSQKSPAYINANYIDGFMVNRAYIGTQGPLPSTFDCFWRMIWEQRVSIIVMITNLVERGRRKCDMYWPKDTETYGFINVKLVAEDVLATYTVRTMVIKHLKVSTPENVKKAKDPSILEKTVYQYHYTNWPDHGTPDHPLPVISFVKKSAAANPPNSGPIVVHCSAGVGRTGTYIVLDAMLKQIAKRQEVNIFGFLKHIRAQRNFLVQTEEQYIFIHDALVEAIEAGESEIPTEKFSRYVDIIQNPEKADVNESEWRPLVKQFEQVIKFKPRDFNLVSANKPVNAEKNRCTVLVPVENARVHLTPRPGEDGSDYINASWIAGFHCLREFIITQHPIDREDFWKMCWDHAVQLIVMISIVDDEQFEVFWPEGDEVIGNDLYNCRQVMVNRNGPFVTREFVLRSVQDDYEIKTRFVQSYNWPHQGVPSIKNMYDLPSFAIGMQDLTQGPVCVVDRFGGTEAATLCALMTLKRQLAYEQKVDVYMYAKLYHNKRPGIWLTLEDYLKLFLCVQSLISNDKRLEEMSPNLGAKANGNIARIHSTVVKMPSSASNNSGRLSCCGEPKPGCSKSPSVAAIQFVQPDGAVPSTSKGVASELVPEVKSIEPPRSAPEGGIFVPKSILKKPMRFEEMRF
ncbi:tyrosine-protein phosphatase 99A-like [Anthonomus grandis grandis]|uniref:tyrosine-protein phosphatase 99A-like n=1 Tax=Anthonomus grandis grandis TaxID=2921223 RepID=UPI00216669D0|nr:tyrosine-protein phosphatase 99A-like [Anthonomus grandis grandis]